MDGNSTTFQMLDEACVLGWWSKSLCDGSSIFAEPKPYIELSFVQRPIISWIIIGEFFNTKSFDEVEPEIG